MGKVPVGDVNYLRLPKLQTWKQGIKRRRETGEAACCSSLPVARRSAPPYVISSQQASSPAPGPPASTYQSGRRGETQLFRSGTRETLPFIGSSKTASKKFEVIVAQIGSRPQFEDDPQTEGQKLPKGETGTDWHSTAN